MKKPSIKTVSIISATLLLAATVAVLFYFLVWAAIGGSYHPNSMSGHLGTRFLWVFAIGAIVNAVWAWIIVGKPLPKLIGRNWFFLILVTAGPTVLNEIPSNQRISYFIRNEEYAIPWQYNPINGSEKPGGSYFVIHVTYPDLIGQYADGYSDQPFELSIWIGSSGAGVGGERQIDELGICPPGARGERVYWYSRDREIVYRTDYSCEILALDGEDGIGTFKNSIENLFESFRVVS